MHREALARLVALATLLVVLAFALLFAARQEWSAETLAGAIDPARWAEQYPQHYASFLRTAQSDTTTAHGGSLPVDLLAANPFRARAFAGSSFALGYTAARGHVYALEDQRSSQRTLELRQPAGCINCHAAEAPQLIDAMGWDALHALDYDDVAENLHFGRTATRPAPWRWPLRVRPCATRCRHRGSILRHCHEKNCAPTSARNAMSSTTSREKVNC